MAQASARREVHIAAAVTPHRFRVTDYERMIEAGILTEDDRVELIAGEIVQKAPVSPYHADCVRMLNHLLYRQVGSDLLAGVHAPVCVSDDSEPEPDLVVVCLRRYRQALPTPADILLLIEVAETSRDFDRDKKLPLYAESGIAEAWLVDLVDETIERHTDPRPGGYRQITRAKRGEPLASTVLPAVTLDVDAVLGYPAARFASASAKASSWGV